MVYQTDRVEKEDERLGRQVIFVKGRPCSVRLSRRSIPTTIRDLGEGDPGYFPLEGNFETPKLVRLRYKIYGCLLEKTVHINFFSSNLRCTLNTNILMIVIKYMSIHYK